MWLLECEGEVLGGKKLWLKPGNKYVMGRAPSPEVNLPMPSQKSISRVHLVIDVGGVVEGDGLKLLHRSSITVQDCKTKHGTRLDGEEMRNETKMLDGDEHFFHLGKYEPGFRLFWSPVVISVSLSSKERKDKKAMSPYQKKVETLDIKTIGTFVPETTHVVATKRNTAVGLQALVNGRYIVTPSYLDAIVEAATIPLGESEVVRSRLETDFEGNWPNPEDYLPPYTNEPKDREAWRFRPNEKRQSLFEGYNFIVCERAQYDNFLGPITDAHGKLEKYDLEPRKTTAEDLVQFVKKREQGSQVVIVRFLGKKDPEWENQLSTEVQEMLGFRMVEQNEFLDTIIMCDKGSLRMPLREQATSVMHPSVHASSPPSRIPDSPQFESTPTLMIPNNVKTLDVVAPQKPAQPTQVSTRGRGRVRSRIQAFDPFAIDPSEFKPPPTQGLSNIKSQTTGLQDHTASLTPITPHTQVSLPDKNPTIQVSVRHSTRQSQQSFSTSIEVDEQKPTPTQESSVRLFDTRGYSPHSVRLKRSIQLEDDRASEPFDVMDILPGAKAVKRRKIVEEEERLWRGEGIIKEPLRESTPALAPEPVNVVEKVEKISLKGKGKKTLKGKEKGELKNEDPYVARAREIKEREEEEARVAKEEELAVMDGLEIEKMRNLAIVEVMEIKPRSDKPVRGEYGDEGARWDDKWNGRKNFKKFRRQGRGGGMRTMRGSVMVNLVEHKGRDYGIGDGYWVDNDEGNKSPKKRSQKAVPAPAAEDSESSQHDTPFRPMHSQSVRLPAQAQTQMEASSSGMGNQAASADTTSRGTKRGAPATQMGRTGGGKKQKTLFLKNQSGSEDDSEDELKFRFRRK